MKKMTLWQRLNAAQAILIALLLLGGGFALRIEQSNATAERRRAQLDRVKNRVYFDLQQMGYAVRGAILDARNGNETNRWSEAQKDLAAAVADPEFRHAF